MTKKAHQNEMKKVLADIRRYARKTGKTPFEIIYDYRNEMITSAGTNFNTKLEFELLDENEEAQVIKEFIDWY